MLHSRQGTVQLETSTRCLEAPAAPSLKKHVFESCTLSLPTTLLYTPTTWWLYGPPGRYSPGIGLAILGR
jgi:hypothetical protein